MLRREILLATTIFTDSALWAGSAIESSCPSVCMCVTEFAIVDYGQVFKVFVFFHKIGIIRVFKVLRILNLEEQQKCMIGSKGKTILAM